MKTIINKYHFDSVWHFTDKSNLESIEKNQGLLSLGELERRGISIATPGGNLWSHDADKIKGLHEYVHLAFVSDHPMLFIAKQEKRIVNPIWLRIQSEILLGKDVRFCSDVSNKAGVIILEPEQARERIDFEVLFEYTNWKDPEIKIRRQSAIKSEILIPGLVPIDKILDYKNG